MRKILICLAVGIGFLASLPALAHHGWSWTTGGIIELLGVIKTANLGYPHGVVEVDAEGDVWTVEVGQPWRNERAGLKPDDFKPGMEMRFIGQPSSNVKDRLMKAEKIYIGETLHNLYPDRD